MGRISSDIGLISGIKTKDIIDQLMALEARPKDLLQTRIDSVNRQKLAYTDVVTRLASLKLNGTTLKKPSTFQAASTTSSNENVLTATAANGAAIGSYQFQVARLVATQQSVSGGFADFDHARVGAGTMTIELGGGDLTSESPLAQLRGGDGVRRGLFRIIDRSGNTAVIDTTAAVTLDDVVNKINTSLDINVRASVGREGLLLSDLTGKTTGNFIVQDVGSGHAAEDLGLVASVAASTITGSDINSIGRATALAQLNDGRGVRSTGGKDFTITAGTSTYDISLGSAKTIGAVLDAINAVAPTEFKAEIADGGNGIKLTDFVGGGRAFGVTAVGGSNAAADLGIDQVASGGVLNGSAVIAGLNTVMIASLKGGTGLPLGSITIRDRSGASDTIDLSSATSVQDILDAISNAPNTRVTASLNASHNGIQITDSSGGSGALQIADVDPAIATAAALGLAGTFDASSASGANLQRQWVTENTLLSDYNGGKGVAPGRFRITNSKGVSSVIDLTQGNEIKLTDVIKEINSKDIGITASINANGDGLLLTDGAGGSSQMKVADVDGTAAADLNIKGEASALTIDGSFEKTIAVTASDTLKTIQTKINDLSFGVTASIINDGSSLTPYRLSLTARHAGRDGRVVFDAGATSLQTRNLVEAQDAAVFLGGAGSEQPLLLTAGSNQLEGIVRGVSISLHGVSSAPVTLNVTRDVESVVTQLQQFTDTFNGMVDRIAELTKFDTDTHQRGLLLGETTIQQVQTEIYAGLNTVVTGAGRYRILADVGISLGAGAKLEFDEEKFRAAYARDPDAVGSLFTLVDKGAGAAIESRITKLIDPVNGVITQQNKTLDQRTDQFQDRIDSLDKLLTSKRTRLETQFAHLESVLANLQAQQQSLAQIKTINADGSSS